MALGVEAGLDESALSRSLIEGTYAEAVERDLAEAQEIGITGVPFFVFDRRFAVSGAQQPDVFTQALRQAWENRT